MNHVFRIIYYAYYGEQMKVHILQHVPFEDIGSMASWLADRKATIGYTRFYESPTFPEISQVDLLIIMGGPMSVNNENTFPWLRSEKHFIREAIRCGIPIVGICLGAQLIANSLGARVYANPEKEIGWFDIENVPNGETAFKFPTKITVFHWHGETFDLPEGAIHLASSVACKHQAFQIGQNVIGLQFHLESTPASIDAMIQNCRNELVKGHYIQTEENIRTIPENNYQNINQLIEKVLSYITQALNYTF